MRNKQIKNRMVGLRPERGFTLLEVMVSLAILSIGLLGIAATQDAAFRGTAFGSRMSIGTNLADEMIERIRIKPPGVITPGFTVSDYDGVDTDSISTRPASWQAGGDYDQWRARILSNLPDGRGQISVTQPVPNPLGQNDVTVTITWPGVGTTHTITMMTSLL